MDVNAMSERVKWGTYENIVALTPAIDVGFVCG